jgi:geranylgeranyl reductase family protein
MTRDVDVVVVGAGPAGASCAAWLALSNLSVLVVDKAPKGRDKCCGDGLTHQALQELDALGVIIGEVPSQISVVSAVFVSPRGRHVVLPTSSPPISVVVRRTELDQAIIDNAERLGAEVVREVSITSLSRNGERILVGLSDGSSASTSYVVAADGAWSTVRTLCGIEPAHRPAWTAFRTYVPRASDAKQWVWFAKEMLPGYAWAFPLADDSWNIGATLPSQTGMAKASVANAFFSQPAVTQHIGKAEALPTFAAWPIPTGMKVHSAVSPNFNTMFVGDALHSADTLTGEGIAQALTTGRLAAEAISDTGTVSEAMLAYRKLVATNFKADQAMACALSRLLASSPITSTVLRLIDTSDWTRSRFASWAFEAQPRAIALTPRRWGPARRHRQMFARQVEYGRRHGRTSI